MWREKLATELHALDTSDDDSREDRGTVTLDQQSVGRLSRMDAMQRQAMAQATSRRRAQRRARILAALARLDEGEYGVCQDCGEDIPPGRLELDPTVATCVSCANG
ncbi:TraR/DksA family transcriptional regulator [Alphaproteobacteria bacterium GH1-50]|uniref:TraR/DksA family transcriptional regulator n=2 Tax=Kangsaoukella pontilimi TaxID=2691042 RepID=A0A7C9INW6_9RHOB|nr:TraR/DksA family transcriptional regulator [Kangsaoukella pontilimi]